MTFDEMFYLQIHGTSMGTVFPPTFATLFICFHEIEPYAIIRDNSLFQLFLKQNWERFLDDCFIFLRLSLIKANELLDALNNINTVTQFTIGKSDT